MVGYYLVPVALRQDLILQLDRLHPYFTNDKKLYSFHPWYGVLSLLAGRARSFYTADTAVSLHTSIWYGRLYPTTFKVSYEVNPAADTKQFLLFYLWTAV